MKLTTGVHRPLPIGAGHNGDLLLVSLKMKSYTLFVSNSIKYGQVQTDVPSQLLGNLLGVQ